MRVTAGSARPDTNQPDVDARSRLVDAAIHIASTEGLDKVTYRSVGAAAGLSHSLVRFHFGTGSALVREALERAARLDVEESHINAETIDDFATNLLEVATGERGRGMLQFDYLLRAVRGGLPVDGVVALYDFMIEEVSGTLTNVGIDDPDGSFAALLVGMIDGLILQHAIYQSAERTESVLRQIRRVLRMARDGQPAEPEGRTSVR